MGLIKPISMTELSGNIKLINEYQQMFPRVTVSIPVGETATVNRLSGKENCLMTNFPYDSGMWGFWRVLPIACNMVNMTLRNIPFTDSETAQLMGADLNTPIHVYRKEGL